MIVEIVPFIVHYKSYMPLGGSVNPDNHSSHILHTLKNVKMWD
jgi:hypothetical protein